MPTLMLYVPPTAAASTSTTSLQLDPVLLHAVIQGTAEGLQMTGVQPPPVGASKFFTAARPISVIVGLVGENNGTITLNMGEAGMLYLAGKLLGETQKEINEDNFDAISEIGNMVGGRCKEALVDTPWESSHISVPSVILGANYNVYYTRGINVVSVEFEFTDFPVTFQKERFFSTTISLMRRMG